MPGKSEDKKGLPDGVFPVREPDPATCETNSIGYVPSVIPLYPSPPVKSSFLARLPDD
jgi:hypothetical protein